ncbi:MAG: YkgJ family cysteine cluster protein, partial [Myxococcota bacterium]
LDAIWIAAARSTGLTVGRSSEVFAATDGRGELLLGEASTLDADDALAQMIFHEICHWIVEGRGSFHSVDWGLSNAENEEDVSREHAGLRVQAYLAGLYGLRTFLAPTTKFRSFYDALPQEPIEGEGSDVRLAREGLIRAEISPWSPHLERALGATRRIVFATRQALLDLTSPDVQLLYFSEDEALRPR